MLVIVVVAATWGLWHTSKTSPNAGSAAPTPPPSVHYAATSVTDLGATAPGSHRCAAANGQCTLRAAIEEGGQDVAAQRATVVAIDLPAGTYKLSSVLAITRGSVTVNGADRAKTVIDAGGTDRAFDVASGASLTLHNLTITNGSSAAEGGAIRAADSTITLDAVTVTASSATDNGGAVFAAVSTVNITGSTFDQDSGRAGGALAIMGGSLTLTGTTFSHSSASADGGALWVRNATSVSVTRCTFTSDVAQGSGGAVSINGADGTPTYAVDASTFTANSAEGGDGGGIATDALVSASGHATLRVTGSTFSGGRATGAGGAVSVPAKSVLNETGNTYQHNDAPSNPDVSAP